MWRDTLIMPDDASTTAGRFAFESPLSALLILQVLDGDHHKSENIR